MCFARRARYPPRRAALSQLPLLVLMLLLVLVLVLMVVVVFTTMRWWILCLPLVSR